MLTLVINIAVVIIILTIKIQQLIMIMIITKKIPILDKDRIIEWIKVILITAMMIANKTLVEIILITLMIITNKMLVEIILITVMMITNKKKQYRLECHLFTYTAQVKKNVYESRPIYNFAFRR